MTEKEQEIREIRDRLILLANDGVNQLTDEDAADLLSHMSDLYQQARAQAEQIRLMDDYLEDSPLQMTEEQLRSLEDALRRQHAGDPLFVSACIEHFRNARKRYNALLKKLDTARQEGGE